MRKRIKELTDEKIQDYKTNTEMKKEVQFLINQNSTLKNQMEIMGGKM